MSQDGIERAAVQPRRKFLAKLAGGTLGAISAASAVFVLVKGTRIDPFVRDELGSLLTRFGTGRELLSDLPLGEARQRECAPVIAEIKERCEGAKGSSTKAFKRELRERIRQDFEDEKVVVVNGWILTESEVGVFLFNRYKRRGLTSK